MSGGLSIWHILILAVIVMVLFGGRGKISELMGDFAKGIKSFKKGLTEEDQQPPRSLPPENRDEAQPTNKDPNAQP